MDGENPRHVGREKVDFARLYPAWLQSPDVSAVADRFRHHFHGTVIVERILFRGRPPSWVPRYPAALTRWSLLRNRARARFDTKVSSSVRSAGGSRLSPLDHSPGSWVAGGRHTSITRVCRQSGHRDISRLWFAAGRYRLFHLAGAVDVVVLATHAAGLRISFYRRRMVHPGVRVVDLGYWHFAAVSIGKHLRAHSNPLSPFGAAPARLTGHPGCHAGHGAYRCIDRWEGC